VWAEHNNDEDTYNADDDGAVDNVNEGRVTGSRSSSADSRRPKTSTMRRGAASPSRKTVVQPQVY